MKKILVSIVLVTSLISCGLSNDPKVNERASEESYIGTFHGVRIYQEFIPHGISGTVLYLGFNEKGEGVSITSLQHQGKTTVSVPVIMINGRETNLDDAKKILGDY